MRGGSPLGEPPRSTFRAQWWADHHRNASGTPDSGLTGGSHPSSRRARSDEKGLSRARKSSDDDAIALSLFPTTRGATDLITANAARATTIGIEMIRKC